METGFIILSIFMLCLGVVIGIFAGGALAKKAFLRDAKYTQGTLNADCSMSNTNPMFFLSLGVQPEDIISRSYVTLDVNVIRPNSHE